MNQTLSPDEFEIIIIDNAPDQDAARNLGAFYAGIAHLRYRVIGTPGLSNASNVGIGQARSGGVVTQSWFRRRVARSALIGAPGRAGL